MGMLKINRLPLPVSFMIVLSMLIVLFIFFGAWAVTVDAAIGSYPLRSETT